MQADKLRELRNLVVGGVYALTPDQQRAIDDLLAIAEAAEDLRADAMRYRWLCDGAGDDVCIRARGTSPTHPHLYAHWKCTDKSKIDDFIDAALSTVAPVREGT